VDSRTEVPGIYRLEEREKIPLVESQADIVAAVQADHDATRAWVGQPVGTITAPINSFFALVQDDPSIQIVTDAQMAYGERAIQGTEYDGLPVLSAGAPFKAGGRGGPDNYTDLPAGEIAIRNVADLYVYPNTVRLVKLDGAQVREWLERAAAQFNTIDPSVSETQFLVSETHPSYNFDVIDGVSYRNRRCGPGSSERGCVRLRGRWGRRFCEVPGFVRAVKQGRPRPVPSQPPSDEPLRPSRGSCSRSRPRRPTETRHHIRSSGTS